MPSSRKRDKNLYCPAIKLILRTDRQKIGKSKEKINNYIWQKTNYFFYSEITRILRLSLARIETPSLILFDSIWEWKKGWVLHWLLWADFSKLVFLYKNLFWKPRNPMRSSRSVERRQCGISCILVKIRAHWDYYILSGDDLEELLNC